MADIQLRFHNDMLVLSSPVTTQLERLGVDTARDNELTLLLEPEILNEAYALEMAAGAQCLVADTAFMTPARLAHSRLKDKAPDLAKSALQVVRGSEECGLSPQHVLVEIGPCGLPLDACSKASLLENRDQYTRAVRPFLALEPLLDAYFLNGFTRVADLKCALMGVRKVTDKPVFASVTLDGALREPLSEAIAAMGELGAQVAGFETAAPIEEAVAFAREAKAVCAGALPVLVQLRVREINPEQKAPTPENPYFEPDTMVDAADALKAAGVQFLRAVGNATPSYAGALVAATLGDSVSTGADAAEEDVLDAIDEAQLQACVSEAVAEGIGAGTGAPAAGLDPELADLADMLRQRLNDALGS